MSTFEGDAGRAGTETSEQVKPEPETLRSRVAELHSIQAQINSEDLRLTIRAAIDDCEWRLARLEDDADGWPTPAPR